MRWIMVVFSIVVAFFTAFTLIFVLYADESEIYSQNVPEITLSCGQVKDSAAVFSSFPLTVSISKKFMVKTLTLGMSKNRLWNCEDTTVKGNRIGKSNKFQVSFSDTGWKRIRCVARLAGGDSVESIKCIHVFLPLCPIIIGKNNDTLRLVTPPVTDAVYYVWQFDGGPLVLVDKPEVEIPDSGLTSINGTLFVTNNRQNSPAVRFSFILPPGGDHFTSVTQPSADDGFFRPDVFQGEKR